MRNWGKYLLTRIIGLVITLWVILTISFFVIRLAPGGPFDTEKPLPQLTKTALEEKYHLNDPMIQQYIRYFSDIVKGDLGPSMHYDRGVNFYIFSGLPNSLILGILALMLATSFGLGFGIIAALRQNRWQDYLTITVTSLGISLPLFVIGPLLMYFLALKWQLLPTSGWFTGRFGWKTMIMPIFTLSLPYLANIARLSRASAIDVLQSDYIRTAIAKGLPMYLVVFKHMLKGTLLPVISYLAPAFAGVVTGSVVVEKIFSVPGLGQFLVQSSFNRDYPMVLGMVIVYSSILIVMNFFADIAYTFVDPRITYK